MLIIFGGLPGSGKSTIASRLASQLNTVYVRIDSIETAIQNSSLNVQHDHEAGYLVAYKIAKDNLNLGNTVIADSVNPIEISRKSWRNVALQEKKEYLEIEIFCSDKKEHKQRIEKRNSDIHDDTPQTIWEEIMQYDYEVWHTPELKFDTFKTDTETCIVEILKKINT